MLITYLPQRQHILHLARLLRLATTPVRLNATLVSPCLKLPRGDFQQILLASVRIAIASSKSPYVASAHAPERLCKPSRSISKRTVADLSRPFAVAVATMAASEAAARSSATCLANFSSIKRNTAAVDRRLTSLGRCCFDGNLLAIERCESI